MKRQRGSWSRFSIPTVLFAVVVLFYLSLSGAPLRVHVCSIACLWLGLWLPAVIAQDLHGLRQRFVAWPLPIVLSMLVWDASPLVLGGKREPFFMAGHTPWLYLLGLLALASLTALSASLVGVIASRSR